MRVKLIVLALAFMFLDLPAMSQTQEEIASVIEQIAWREGPSTFDFGQVAEIFVPEGYIFAGPDDARQLLEVVPYSAKTGMELGLVAPNTLDWLLLFEFMDVGYIKDEKSQSLEADKVLNAIRKFQKEFDEDRSSKPEIVGWFQPPEYNPENHSLEWAIRGELDGVQFESWSLRLLGREGMMKVTLDAIPGMLEEVLPETRSILAALTFKPGHRYADFVKGDKEAEFDLADAVTGNFQNASARGNPRAAALFKLIMSLVVLVSLVIVGTSKKIQERLGFK